jgi:hypothetical protein
MPQINRWNASWSSSESRNSTQVVATRKVGKLLRSALSAPGKRTGIARNRLQLFLTRRSIAARISSFCHGPKPLGPTNTAQVSDFGQGLFNRWLPWIARNKVPFVQPSLYPLFREAARDLLYGRFISTAVR